MSVQEEVIPYLLGENNDVVALAQTGTGKTAAFGLPLIQKINVNNRNHQSLIHCHTRELSLQKAGNLIVGNFRRGMRSTANREYFNPLGIEYKPNGYGCSAST